MNCHKENSASKSEMNLIFNRVNRKQQTREIIIGRYKKESITYLSKPIKKFMYTEGVFLKIVHINITE